MEAVKLTVEENAVDINKRERSQGIHLKQVIFGTCFDQQRCLRLFPRYLFCVYQGISFTDIYGFSQRF